MSTRRGGDEARPGSHDDWGTPAQLRADCLVVGDTLRLGRIARAAAAPAPSLRFEDYPREVRKRDIEISDAAARLAAALQLHLD